MIVNRAGVSLTKDGKTVSTTPVDVETVALDAIIANVDVLAAPPASDTGQAALAVRVISQLGAGGGGASSVSVSNFPATQAVTGTFYQATQPVSGTVGVNNFPSSQAVTGTFFPAVQPISDNNSSITVDGAVSVSNFPASQAVTGTFWQATQPVSGTVTANAGTGTMAVSGPLTDAQLRATAVPVSGTFWQTTQPISGTVSVTALPTGTNNIGDVDVLTLPALTAAAAISNSPIGSVSIGNSLGKVNVMRTGALVTTAVTADQVILTYTVTAGKTLYLTYFVVSARLTTFATTATNFGLASLESPAATKLITAMNSGAGITDLPPFTFSEPIPIAAGTVIRVVCTPGATTSYTWQANFGGYEK